MNSSLFPPSEDASASSGMLVAHCDGGSRGNPGPAGYGAVIEDRNGRIVARLSEFLGNRTNNFAEYSALLGVLAWCLENHHSRLRVIADSELMVKQMKGQYRVKSPDLLPLYEEARKRASKLDRFEIQHTLRGGNKEADQLANEAMDRGMGRGKDRVAESMIRKAAAPASVPAPAVHVRPMPSPGTPAGKSSQPRQVLEGFVKNGVIHLIEGELPDGIFVKIVRE